MILYVQTIDYPKRSSSLNLFMDDQQRGHTGRIPVERIKKKKHMHIAYMIYSLNEPVFVKTLLKKKSIVMIE